jgi:hypothetical protein
VLILSRSQAPKNVVPAGDDAPHTDPANHSGQHGAGGGGSGGGVMGQGQDEGGKTMEKENRSRSHLDLTTSEKSSMDEKPEISTGIERSHHNGHVITRRARSNTQDLETMDGAALEGKKSGRGRSGTLFGGSGKDAGSDGKNAGGDGSATASASATTGQTGNEAHDHDEAFPEEERQQMKALLEEVTGQLGEPLSSSLFSTCERLTDPYREQRQSSSRRASSKPNRPVAISSSPRTAFRT